jgi:hypothetical protein
VSAIGEGPAQEPEDRDDDQRWNVVLDEEFVRSAAVKEPGARARQLAARWSDQPPPAAPWREAADTPRARLSPTASARGRGARGARARRVARDLLIAAAVGAAVVCFIRFWP